MFNNAALCARRCRSGFGILCLGVFILIVMIPIMEINTIHRCNDKGLIETNYSLHKSSIKVQNLKNENAFIQTTLEKTKNQLQKERKGNSTFPQPGLPIIYVITPTHTRLEQKAELTRMSHTLRLVKNLHWIIIEDAENKTKLVANFLKNSGLQYTHINAKTPKQFQLSKGDKYGMYPRGVVQRNAGLEWIRTEPNTRKHKDGGVFYFADDDNAYSLELFDEMRFTKKVSVWPVGLVSKLRYESPIIKDKKVVGWLTHFMPNRAFAIDMAGFAGNIHLILNNPKAGFTYKIRRGFLESNFLSSLGITRDDLEPKANLCTKVLVWHTRTSTSNISDEAKMIKMYGNGTDLNVEV